MITNNQRDLIRLHLASSLSEQSRFEEAANIQESIIKQNSSILSDPFLATSLLSDLGNSYRELGKIGDAYEKFKHALEFIPHIENESNRKEKEFHTLALLAQILFIQNNLEEAERILSRAESLIDVSGIDKINFYLRGTDLLFFYSLSARCYFNAKMFEKAIVYLKKTREQLYNQLELGSLNLNVWESMLSTWSYIDGRSIEIILTDKSNKPNKESIEEALIIGEAAKGRMLSKIMSALSPTETETRYKLSLDNNRQALNIVKDWIAKHPGRQVVSLFADENGLAVFSIRGNGSTSGQWIKEVGYQQFLIDNYEPWDFIMSGSMFDPKLRNVAGALTEFLLDKVGEWFWRSNPDLAKGGEDLIIIPHRLFRNLPLSYSKLPGGERLSECFERITTFTSLYDFSVSLQRSKRYLPSISRSSLVDPDGSLPFARLEGLLAAGINNTKIGSDVTVNAIQDLLSKQGIILLSSHGNFDIYDAWQSSINTADGKIELSKLLLDHIKIAADLVVLGVCEVGRSRRSYSDEPIGFPGVLIQAGVPAVVAPMWKVDDFSSLLFVTTFFQYVSEGIHLASALQKSALWLRQLDASNALKVITRLEDQMENINKSVDISNTLNYLKNRLEDMKQWLQTEPPSSFPFRSPLDWASFQITGFVPIKTVAAGGQK
jgi:tetratricopeptide (TPR) repeat protein